MMPFCPYNTLEIFQAYINEILQEFLDHFCTIYIDEIIINSKSVSAYIEIVKNVLSKLYITRLFLDI